MTKTKSVISAFHFVVVSAEEFHFTNKDSNIYFPIVLGGLEFEN